MFSSNFEEDEDMDEEAIMVTCGKLTLNPASEDNMVEENDNMMEEEDNMMEDMPSYMQPFDQDLAEA